MKKVLILMLCLACICCSAYAEGKKGSISPDKYYPKATIEPDALAEGMEEDAPETFATESSDGNFEDEDNAAYADNGSFEDNGNAGYSGGGSFEPAGYAGGGSIDTNGYSGGGSYEDYYPEQVDYDYMRQQYNEVDDYVDVYEDEMPRYIVYNVYVFNEEEPDPVQYPDELAGQFANYEIDNRRYPYHAKVSTNGGALNVRSGPSTGYHVVGKIPNGMRVVVYGRSIDLNWAYVVAENGCQGFVLDAYLTTRGLAKTVAQTTTQIQYTGELSFEVSNLEDSVYYTSEVLFEQHTLTAVNFWATWCGPCQGELPELAQMDKRLEAVGCGVIGICIDAQDDETAMEGLELLGAAGVEYENLRCPSNLDDMISITAVPTTVIVDSEGRIIEEPIEGADPNGVEQKVYNLLAMYY